MKVLLVLTAGLTLLLTGCSQEVQSSDVSLEPTKQKGAGTLETANLGADLIRPFAAYRIPALAYLGDGVVLAAWDGRPYNAADAPNPNSIVQRRSTDGGATWGPTQIVAAGSVTAAEEHAPKFGYSDPSYVYDEITGKVFMFFVYSKDQGFAGSTFGNDDADRNVISSAVAESSDGGRTWSAPRLITEVTKPNSVRSTFASSGQGIQLKYGPYAGRLLQQYAGDIQQPDGSRTLQAYSVYSDDHGETWKMGEPVGREMDENKVVELSDGRVLLNSRDSARGGYRKVALSEDGGHSYGPVTTDFALPDPTNNAAITRLFPDAPQGSADAKKLVFSNANSQTARRNLTVRVSCDDGASWASARTLTPDFAAYSTLTRLEPGYLGLLYEGSYENDIIWAKFNDAWLDYVCVPLRVDDVVLAAGQKVAVPVTLTNQEARAVSGHVRIAPAAGWQARPVRLKSLEPGESRTLLVPLKAKGEVASPAHLEAVFSAATGGESRRTFRVSIP